MKKISNFSSIHGGETHGSISGAVFGMGAMWLLVSKKGASGWPSTGIYKNTSFVIMGALATCAALPALADTFKSADQTIIACGESLYASSMEYGQSLYHSGAELFASKR